VILSGDVFFGLIMVAIAVIAGTRLFSADQGEEEEEDD